MKLEWGEKWDRAQTCMAERETKECLRDPFIKRRGLFPFGHRDLCVTAYGTHWRSNTHPEWCSNSGRAPTPHWKSHNSICKISHILLPLSAHPPDFYFISLHIFRRLDLVWYNSAVQRPLWSVKIVWDIPLIVDNLLFKSGTNLLSALIIFPNEFFYTTGLQFVSCDNKQWLMYSLQYMNYIISAHSAQNMQCVHLQRI